MRKIYRLKNSFFSFFGGIIGSFALTVLYESIDLIGDQKISCCSYLLNWISAILLGISCVLFLCLSINLDAINEKYTLLMSNSMSNSDNTSELWERALRIVVELRLKSAGDYSFKTNPQVITDKQKQLCKMLDIQAIGGSVLLLLGTGLLIISKVV